MVISKAGEVQTALFGPAPESLSELWSGGNFHHNT
jgi:hypothetical protein